MQSKTYLIPVRPISWKRVAYSGHNFFDKQKQEKLAIGLYLAKEHGAAPKFEGPISMDVTFFMPQSTSKSKKSESLWCFKCPDLDNILKFLLDTINDTNCIWHDDRQVAQCTAKKVYDKNPRTLLILSELE